MHSNVCVCVWFSLWQVLLELTAGQTKYYSRAMKADPNKEFQLEANSRLHKFVNIKLQILGSKLSDESWAMEHRWVWSNIFCKAAQV